MRFARLIATLSLGFELWEVSLPSGRQLIVHCSLLIAHGSSLSLAKLLQIISAYPLTDFFWFLLISFDFFFLQVDDTEREKKFCRTIEKPLPHHRKSLAAPSKIPCRRLGSGSWLITHISSLLAREKSITITITITKTALSPILEYIIIIAYPI